MTAVPFVLDTDIGTDVDDALALTFALASPELDLIGVTIVDGDVETRAKIAARVLGMAGRPDIPVLVGEPRPIASGRGPTWFGHEGKGILDLPWEGPEAEILPQPAAEWIVETSRTREFQIVAVGPFSNIAKAVTLDPALPSRIPKLTVMGGMVFPDNYDPQWRLFFEETGLPPNHMDHNTASDVEASYIMANAGFDMTWVTAELTFCTTMNRATMKQFEASGSVLGNRLARMLDIWSSNWFHHIPQFPESARPFPQDAVAALHDPLAVASVFGGDGLMLRDCGLTFARAGQRFESHFKGFADEDADLSGATAVNRVSVHVDRERFGAFFSNRMIDFLTGLEA